MSEKEENPNIQWAIDILTPPPDYELNFLVKYQHYIFFGGISQLSVIFYNIVNKRPHLSGIQRYPLALLAAMPIAHFIREDKKKREGYRDAILKDYIRKFPDDFPEPVKRTYNDVFHPWNPFR